MMFLLIPAQARALNATVSRPVSFIFNEPFNAANGNVFAPSSYVRHSSIRSVNVRWSHVPGQVTDRSKKTTNGNILAPEQKFQYNLPECSDARGFLPVKTGFTGKNRVIFYRFLASF